MGPCAPVWPVSICTTFAQISDTRAGSTGNLRNALIAIAVLSKFRSTGLHRLHCLGALPRYVQVIFGRIYKPCRSCSM